MWQLPPRHDGQRQQRQQRQRMLVVVWKPGLRVRLTGCRRHPLLLRLLTGWQQDRGITPSLQQQQQQQRMCQLPLLLLVSPG
jgi:hypothetical protein